MPLELRDPATGALLGSYTTIDPMLTAVREAVTRHGRDHVARWELMLSNEYGGARAALQGAALVQRALEAPSDEQAWYDANRLLLEDAYLASEDPRRGSGFGGDADRWRHARGVIAEAIHHDGSFLDVGCANGLLMESIVAWAAAHDRRIEPSGLDISTELAALARRRLPIWADRIYTGNVIDWQPPRRFDFVRTELVYVPEARQPILVARLLREFLTAGGRAVLCQYLGSGNPSPPPPITDQLRDWGFVVAGEAVARDPDGRVRTRVAWIDA